jgi:hypothetical protein
MEVALWILFAVSTALYWWVGKVFVSQPKHNHPQLFWNQTVAETFVIAPLLGLGAVAVGGFVFTTNGWWFLGAAVAAFLLLGVRPGAS